MNALQDGKPLVCGLKDRLSSDQIVNLPECTLRVKIRCRPDAFTTAYVKTPSGVFRHYIYDVDDGIELTECVAANLNRKPNTH